MLHHFVMGREIEKLVEYRKVHYSASSEASTYFTNQAAAVGLRFSNPIVCKMLSGHKIMKVGTSAPFHFLPGESMMVPPDMALAIEFPFADADNPTTCACIEIERSRFDTIIANINETRRKCGERRELAIDWTAFAVYRGDEAVDRQLDRLMQLYLTDGSEFRDLLIDTNLTELAVRLLQAQARHLLIEARSYVPDTGLDAVARYILSQPGEAIDLEHCARIAGMSLATFFRHFRAKFGTTPSRFANQARIQRARELLTKGDTPVSEIGFDVGFQSAAHFNRVFKQFTGETPGEFARRACRPAAMQFENLVQRIDSPVTV
jgi:AraC-like DNA-binding protein